MICTRFIYVDIGRSGSMNVRNLILTELNLSWIDAHAHLSLRACRSLQPSHLPSFTVVRNPFDWYISYYLRDLQIHRWRGSFREWVSATKMAELGYSHHWVDMGGQEVDHVGRFETLSDDLDKIFAAIIPDLVTSEQLREWWPRYCSYMRGIEQWLRDELYDTDMVEAVYKKDAVLFERFGYTFEERYYFGWCLPGIPSAHPGVIADNWESERSVSDNWALWQCPS